MLFVMLQVAGEEGWVEVLLVNPCATPLRLQQLQLVVQPLPQQQQQQQGSDSTTTGSSSSSSNAAGKSKQQQSLEATAGGSSSSSSVPAQQQQQQQRSVSVSLAAGSKPVRVLLSYSVGRPGMVAVTGIRVRQK
jgi:cobalamin biosynthesis Mg chelatase CobN